MTPLPRRIRDAMPACDGWSARILDEQQQSITVQRGIPSAPSLVFERGAQITVRVGRGEGYASTADLSGSGLANAAHRARGWAEVANRLGLFDASTVPLSSATGTWSGPCERPVSAVAVSDLIALLQDAGKPFADVQAIVNWTAQIWSVSRNTHVLTSNGADCNQTVHLAVPFLNAIARDGGDTLFRSTGRHHGVQGGFERIEQMDLASKGHHIVDDLRALLAAPPCPEDTRDLLLAPDQMVLQIHESIGHPLELDRILGDERNFAGTSFVTQDMLGTYQYGSEHLNVTFDPTVDGELASAAWDDDGTPTRREHLIRNGTLERLLGGVSSQTRSGAPGVSCSRASSWRRPTMDRMANLNLEPGEHSLADLIGKVERGIYLQTNHSWSIDDRRDKFQFGCEFAQLIEDGELGAVVRKPNYRGRSRDFWRSLAAVGDRSTFEVQGTPFCGKGEPSQIVPVGHASPPALFRSVEVF